MCVCVCERKLVRTAVNSAVMMMIVVVMVVDADDGKTDILLLLSLPTPSLTVATTKQHFVQHTA